MSFPPAPDGVGQVEDLHRTRVTVLYQRGARLCRRRVRAADLADWMVRQPLLPHLPDNPLGRGVMRREKTFGGPRRKANP